MQIINCRFFFTRKKMTNLWRGGGAPRTACKTGVSGHPPKSGVSPPCFFLCKKPPKMAFFLKKRAFFGVFWPIFGHFWPKSRKNVFSVGGVCYEKNTRQGLSSAWQKPANLYSTKCRIFGIWPPVGGHRGGLHHFLRRRPPPEVGPRPPEALLPKP